jgi:hypothetical protein
VAVPVSGFGGLTQVARRLVAAGVRRGRRTTFGEERGEKEGPFEGEKRRRSRRRGGLVEAFRDVGCPSQNALVEVKCLDSHKDCTMGKEPESRVLIPAIMAIPDNEAVDYCLACSFAR